MGAEGRIATADFDDRHKQPRLAVENLFSQQVTKFWNSDTFRSHKSKRSVKLGISMMFVGLKNIYV